MGLPRVFLKPRFCVGQKRNFLKRQKRRPTFVSESDLFKFRILFSAKYTSCFIGKVLTDDLLIKTCSETTMPISRD